MGSKELDDPQGERGPPYGQREDWQNILELLAAGHYRQAASLIRERQAEGGEDSVLANSLAVARQLCLTCHQYRKEIEAHRRSLADATEREKVLRERIFSLLSLASGEELVQAGEEVSPAHLAEVIQSEPNGIQREESPGLWQRIRGLLGLERRTPPAAVEQPQTPLPERVRAEEPAAEEPVMPRRETDSTPGTGGKEKVQIDGAALSVYTLGTFRVYQEEQLIGEWPSLKGQSIFKYLIAQRERPVNKEVLMELFWPDADPDSARNNLNVAIYGLRQAFRQIQPELSYVLFSDDHYLLNPELHVWVDVEAFRERFTKAKQFEERGELVLAASEYHAAEALYQGEFLEEDRYDEWLLPLRQKLRSEYLEALTYLSRYYFNLEDYGASITLCSKILTVDRVREEAHRLYMRCCNRQGQRYLALRQYHQCVEALTEELDVTPSENTVELYKEIRKGQVV